MLRCFVDEIVRDTSLMKFSFYGRFTEWQRNLEFLGGGIVCMQMNSVFFRQTNDNCVSAGHFKLINIGITTTKKGEGLI